MRPLTEPDRLARFMRALGAAATEDTRVYLTGGASAVLLGWRPTTIDVDLVFEPERDELFRAIASLKDELQINVELASPAHFIPQVPGWAERSLFISREGRASFYHYDFYSQALSKIERGHAQDEADVHSMIAAGLVIRQRLADLFAAIEGQLHRYPAVDPPTFKSRVAAIARGTTGRDPEETGH
jgi:hypothetical protein